jgi:flavorubredoxin
MIRPSVDVIISPLKSNFQYSQLEEVTKMAVLVAYASKHGSTRDIAERIAEKLRQLGKEAEETTHV